jgi:hypothetical protein
MAEFAEKLSTLIYEEIQAYGREFERTKVDEADDKEYIVSETIGEVIDKLIILHVRMWHLVDANATVKDSEEWAKIGAKMRHVIDKKRPRLIAALNLMLGEIVKGNLDLVDDEDVKHFTKVKAHEILGK